MNKIVARTILSIIILSTILGTVWAVSIDSGESFWAIFISLAVAGIVTIVCERRLLLFY